MFKNAIAFLVTPGFHIDAEMLSRAQARPCGPVDLRTAGFVNPCSHSTDGLVHRIQGKDIICLETEDRLLPGSVIAQEVDDRCDALADQQGYKPGKGQRREVKEKVITELLPRAFTQRKRTFALFTGQYFIIDTSSGPRADAMIETMKLALGFIPLAPIKTKKHATKEIIQWLLGDFPGSISVDRFVDLEKMEAGKPAITYKRTNLDEEEMRRRIEDGYIPRQLAVTYDDRISFKLDEELHLKQLSVLDAVKDDATKGATNIEEFFDADMLLASGEISCVLDFLIYEFGGLEEQEPDLLTGSENRANESDSDDPMYAEAVGIVVGNQKASISLVQRHLRIGYNRAARLIEDMEKAGIVSQMDNSGVRRVLDQVERKAA